jgi:hypothetical protein
MSSIPVEPPREIPTEYAADFTMNYEIPILDWYINNTLETSIVWDDKVMSDMLEQSTYENVITNCARIDGYDAAKLIMAGLQKIENLPGKSVAVIGSLDPWIECICMNNGIKDVTTVEYNPPVCTHPDLKIMSYNDFVVSDKKYDIIISYSSIEHSGLGRYGDPIDPNGDLKAMDQMVEKLNADGHMLLGIPIGKDSIVWNAHRVYGRKRLKLLLKDVTLVDWIGEVDQTYFDTCDYTVYCPQPLMTLKHKTDKTDNTE